MEEKSRLWENRELQFSQVNLKWTHLPERKVILFSFCRFLGFFKATEFEFIIPLNEKTRIHFMKYIVLIGRILYSAIFIAAALGHFSQDTIQFATDQGMPLAPIFVPLMGILSFLGGLSILIGFKARYGAWLLVIFLLPATFLMHQFWNVQDVMENGIQKAMFLKNLSMLGAALLLTHFGSGPMSVDKRH
jgi:putative oxidoreductase